MTGIYKYTNKITNEIYIGQARNLKNRYNQHKRNYINNSKHNKEYNSILHQKMREYGYDNFDYEIITECSIEDLNKLEIYYINYYDSIFPKGYNVATGGSNGGHPNALNNINEVYEIIDLLKSSTLSNTEIGEIYHISDQTVSDINCGRVWKQDDLSYPIRNKTHKTHNICNKTYKKIIYYCKDCGIVLSGKTKTGMCQKCIAKSITKKPSEQQLRQDMINSNYTIVSKKYGVSDKTIKKWCLSYGIEIKKQPKKDKIIKPHYLVQQYSLSNELINTFNSTREAARVLGKTHQHIQDCCVGKRNSAYGFKWKYVDKSSTL